MQARARKRKSFETDEEWMRSNPVQHRNNSTISFTVEQGQRIVIKKISGRSGLIEAKFHKLACRSSKYVLPLLKRIDGTDDTTLILPYVEAKRFVNFTTVLRNTRKYIYHLCLALSDIHAAGITHGDVKPSNFLVSDKLYFLSDFGLSTRTCNRVNRPPCHNLLSGRGTPAFRAPEIVLNTSATSPASDMWSVGIILLSAIRRRIARLDSDYCCETVNPEHYQALMEADWIASLIGTIEWQHFCTGTPWETLPVRTYSCPKDIKDWRMLAYGRGSVVSLDLLRKLLVLDPDKRLSAYAVLQHPYLAGL